MLFDFVGDAHSLIALQVLIGISQGPIISACLNLFSSWIPVTERCTIVSIAYAGITVNFKWMLNQETIAFLLDFYRLGGNDNRYIWLWCSHPSIWDMAFIILRIWYRSHRLVLLFCKNHHRIEYFFRINYLSTVVRFRHACAIANQCFIHSLMRPKKHIWKPKLTVKMMVRIVIIVWYHGEQCFQVVQFWPWYLPN